MTPSYPIDLPAVIRSWNPLSFDSGPTPYGAAELSTSTLPAAKVRDSNARDRQLHPLTWVLHKEAPVRTWVAPLVSAAPVQGLQVLAASRWPVTDGTSRRFRFPRLLSSPPKLILSTYLARRRRGASAQARALGGGGGVAGWECARGVRGHETCCPSASFWQI